MLIDPHGDTQVYYPSMAFPANLLINGQRADRVPPVRHERGPRGPRSRRSRTTCRCDARLASVTHDERRSSARGVGASWGVRDAFALPWRACVWQPRGMPSRHVTLVARTASLVAALALGCVVATAPTRAAAQGLVVNLPWLGPTAYMSTNMARWRLHGSHPAGKRSCP